MICNFYLSVASRKIFCADLSLRYSSMLLGCYTASQQTRLSLSVKSRCSVTHLTVSLSRLCVTLTLFLLVKVTCEYCLSVLLIKHTALLFCLSVKDFTFFFFSFFFFLSLSFWSKTSHDSYFSSFSGQETALLWSLCLVKTALLA